MSLDPKLRFVLTFSPVRNAKKIFNFKTTSVDVACIHGLRFMSISWIIMGHTFVWANYQLFSKDFSKNQLVKFLT